MTWIATRLQQDCLADKILNTKARKQWWNVWLLKTYLHISDPESNGTSFLWILYVYKLTKKKKETHCPISVWYHIYHQHNDILTNSDKDKTWIIHYVWIQIRKIKVTAYNIITLFHQYFSVTDLKINIFRLKVWAFFHSNFDIKIFIWFHMRFLCCVGEEIL